MRPKRRPNPTLLASPILAMLIFPVAAEPQALPPSGDVSRTVHLLQRATFGVRPQDVERVTALGRDVWLDLQLHPERIADPVVDARLSEFPSLEMSMAEAYAWFLPPQQLQRQLLAQMDPALARTRPDSIPPRNQLPPEMRMQLRQRSPQRLLADLVNAKLVRAVYTDRQLEEVMTDFWFNHFNVFFGKQNTRYMVADYEREAIRPHIFGRFEDMLLATAKHPAMLFYLDNWTSVVPDSMRSATPAQLRRGRGGFMIAQPQQQRRAGRGLNENYARELMELHTLGVDGGYTQQDVIEVARAFTGWTFAPLQQGQRGAGPAQRPPAGRRARPGTFDVPQRIPAPGEFFFNEQGHDRRQKTILGRRFPANHGIEEGEEVIRLLARHPSTAQFIATKLVERFVSDTPDPAFVDELAQVFLDTDGDLREVTRALFTSERFYDPAVIRSKVRTPFELVASALRVSGAEIGPSRRLIETLRTLGQLPYNEPAPTGFPAASVDWVNSGAMLNRMNLALDLASGRVDGVRIDPANLGLVGQRDAGAALPALLATLMPGVDTQALEEVIRADAEQALDVAPRARIARAVGLALGSPDFQKR